MIKIHRKIPKNKIIFYGVTINTKEVENRNQIAIDKILEEEGRYFCIIRSNSTVVNIFETGEDDNVWLDEKTGICHYEEAFANSEAIINLPNDYYSLDLLKVCKDKVYKLIQGETLFLYNGEYEYPATQKGGPNDNNTIHPGVDDVPPPFVGGTDIPGGGTGGSTTTGGTTTGGSTTGGGTGTNQGTGVTPDDVVNVGDDDESLERP